MTAEQMAHDLRANKPIGNRLEMRSSSPRCEIQISELKRVRERREPF